jgi:hypothetical protein
MRHGLPVLCLFLLGALRAADLTSAALPLVDPPTDDQVVEIVAQSAPMIANGGVIEATVDGKAFTVAGAGDGTFLIDQTGGSPLAVDTVTIGGVSSITAITASGSTREVSLLVVKRPLLAKRKKTADDEELLGGSESVAFTSFAPPGADSGSTPPQIVTPPLSPR